MDEKQQTTTATTDQQLFGIVATLNYNTNQIQFLCPHCKKVVSLKFNTLEEIDKKGLSDANRNTKKISHRANR